MSESMNPPKVPATSVCSPLGNLILECELCHKLTGDTTVFPYVVRSGIKPFDFRLRAGMIVCDKCIANLIIERALDQRRGEVFSWWNRFCRLFRGPKHNRILKNDLNKLR
jgi:hypothetical protein